MEIASYRTATVNQAVAIKRLTAEKARYAAENVEAQQKFTNAVDEVKAREITVLQLQKKIVEGEAKLKQQQNLYEAVRSDRNLYSKNLIESQEEIAEMKRKFKIMTRQIEQLKEEIQAKDQQLVKEHFEHMKVDKEKEQLRDSLHGVQKSLQKARCLAPPAPIPMPRPRGPATVTSSADSAACTTPPSPPPCLRWSGGGGRGAVQGRGEQAQRDHQRGGHGAAQAAEGVRDRPLALPPPLALAPASALLHRLRCTAAVLLPP